MAGKRAKTRTTLRRMPDNGCFDRELIHSIIDQALVCHVGFTVDGQPMVIPTCHWRDGDSIYWHAHSKAQNIKGAGDNEVCITITLLDGLVLARSAFSHSVNYRSVMIFGRPQAVDDPAEKVHQLELMVNKLTPGRWSQLRPVTDQEIKATGVLKLDLNELSCKVREGGPHDDDQDLSWPVWAGVAPISTIYEQLEPASDLQDSFDLPHLCSLPNSQSC